MPTTIKTHKKIAIATIPDIPDVIDPGFIRFPNHLLNRLWKFKDGQSWVPLVVFLAILEHDKQGRHKVFPGEDRIKRMTKLAPRTIRRGLRHLEKIGIIRTRIRKGHSSVYRINPAYSPPKMSGQPCPLTPDSPVRI